MVDHSNDELLHYGVLGMKWGVRRGNTSKAFYKASKKANKLQKKYVEKNLKAAKYDKKAFNKEAKATSEKQYKKARKLRFKATKLKLQSAKLLTKGEKWEKKMKSTFSGVKVSDISSEHLEQGRKYVYMLD